MLIASVAYISLFDNDLKVEIVEVPNHNWKTAFTSAMLQGKWFQNSEGVVDPNMVTWVQTDLPDDFDKACEGFNDSDSVVNITYKIDQ